MTEIDVSGCEHYWNTKGLELCKINFDNNYYSNGLPLAEKCSEHKDCYYKQMKRLETENAKLKEKYQEELTVNTQLRKWQDEDLRQIKELKIENDHLIADIKEKEKYLYEQEYLDKGMEKLRQENAKLKEALEKINSIIDNDFINRYMELSFNEYDDILEQIEKICEVMKDE